MASKKALAFLRSVGIEKVHSNLELANFAAGSGTGKLSSPYQIIRMRRLSGDSKETVDWCLTLTQARDNMVKMVDGHRSSQDETEWTYYIRDIRNGKLYS